MKSINKVFCTIVLFITITFSVCAQISIDPSDDFYELVQEWEIRGLVRDLPPMRPYPVNNIQEILQNVIKRGNEEDVKTAIEYWQKITGKAWNINVSGKAVGNLSKTDGDKEFEKLFILSPNLNGDFFLYKDLISIGYKLGITARTKENEGTFLPYAINSGYDARQDAVDAGPFYAYIDINNGVAIGNRDIFVQAGINRTGYGSFFGDGIALNETDYHSANVTISFLKEKWSYVQQYSAIGATTSYDGTGLAPDKFMAFHAFEYRFSKHFSVAYYENIIYGNRFDLSYFLPVPYMAAQGIGGNKDNLQMGLTFKIKPFDSLEWVTDVLVDDIEVDKLIKLDADGKNRFALKTGIFYAPNSFCSLVNFNYTAITPYTYSHWEYDGPNTGSISSGIYNYQNYTNNGVHIGSPYEPNSDIFSFNIRFRPVKNFKLNFETSFMRHANIVESDSDSEAIRYLLASPGTYATDGTIHTHSMYAGGSDGEHVKTAWEQLNFLNQDTKMYVIKAGLSAEYTFPKFKMGLLSLNMGYTFEYIRNKGVDANMYPGQGSKLTDNGDGTFTLGSSTYTQAELVRHFKDIWKANLYDVVNNYFTIGMSFTF